MKICEIYWLLKISFSSSNGIAHCQVYSHLSDALITIIPSDHQSVLHSPYLLQIENN